MQQCESTNRLLIVSNYKTNQLELIVETVIVLVSKFPQQIFRKILWTSDEGKSLKPYA